MRIRWLVYKAWFYWRIGEPIPLDLYGELLRSGISPELMTEAFEDGERPGDLVFVYEQRMGLPIPEEVCCCECCEECCEDCWFFTVHP